ncbi:MAG TPA: YidC/Oxa1 family membrane protein insertase [Candidatus Dormibacteraeota bacterium]|nr:YidC/Oxa1 family membrane protein insertase [Candidatus Dormibacteraeota bacterium]
MSQFLKVFQPIHDAWWAIFGVTLQSLLTFIYNHLAAISVFETIGAYGVAIIVITVIIRLLLAPLQQFQLVTQRKTYAEQRKLAPEVAELRKKYRKDPQRLNTEMMKLYQEHGVNPLSGMIGCLPLIIQIPILTALFYVFTGWAHTHAGAHFLFIPNLNDNPSKHVIASGIPIPAIVYLIFPLLAAATTLIQTRMLQMPAPPNPTDQELQTQQMQRTMLWISPLMIGYFALNVPAGLGLYWFVGNCVSIIQQSFIVGWGNLLPSRFKTVAGGAPSPPNKGPSAGPKPPGPAGAGKPGSPGGGNKPKRPKRK